MKFVLKKEINVDDVIVKEIITKTIQAISVSPNHIINKYKDVEGGVHNTQLDTDALINEIYSYVNATS